MFKVVALLAVIGSAAAGVSVRDAVALNNQIATQNAINLNGALRNGILTGQVGALPLTYTAGVPALGVSQVVGVPALGLGYSAVSARDAVALGNQIATQNAINSQGAISARDAVALNNQIATQNAINAQGALQSAVLTRGAVVVAGEDVHAVNDKINTQIAIQQGIAARNAGLLSEGNVVGVVGAPAVSVLSAGGVVSARDAAALNAQIATQNAINAQGALRNSGVVLVQ